MRVGVKVQVRVRVRIRVRVRVRVRVRIRVRGIVRIRVRVRVRISLCKAQGGTNLNPDLTLRKESVEGPRAIPSSRRNSHSAPHLSSTLT